MVWTAQWHEGRAAAVRVRVRVSPNPNPKPKPNPNPNQAGYQDAVPAVLYLQQLEAAALSRHGDAHRAGVEAAEWREGRAMQGETRAARRETGGRGVAMAYAACSGGPDWRRGAGHGVAERTYSLASPNPNPNPTRKGGESTADLSASSEQVRVRVRDRVRVALAAAFACSRASL